MFHKDKELKLAKGAVEGGHMGDKNLRFFCSISIVVDGKDTKTIIPLKFSILEYKCSTFLY